MRAAILFLFLFLPYGCSAKDQQIVLKIGGCLLQCATKCTAEQLASQAIALKATNACKIKPTSKPANRSPK